MKPMQRQPPIESLEPRTFLSANPLTTATTAGWLSKQKTFDGSLSATQKTIYYKFATANKGNVNLTLGLLHANADMALLDRNGKLLAQSILSGTTPDRISKTLGAGVYMVRVKLATAAGTSYRLALRDDLNWGTVTLGGSHSSVGLYAASGSTGAISTGLDTWVFIHGWMGSPGEYSDLTDALRQSSKNVQVLVLDWSKPASSDMMTAFSWADPVGQWAADKLTQWGLPAAKINVISHSMGGYVADILADDLPAGVNRQIALDPATPWPLGNTDYAAHSQFSLSLITGSLSTPQAALTADETFQVNIGVPILTHMEVADLFTTMLEENNSGSPDAVSRLFALNRLSQSVAQPWETDGYSDGYEGTLSGSGGLFSTAKPSSLTYKSAATGQEVTVNA